MPALTHTLAVTWSPFVLVAGLLLIGRVAAGEGLFALVGSWCARGPGGARASLVVTLLAVALVTAVLNLDTSVVFMTPVALHAARRRSTDEPAFLYGTVFMSNSASLLLVGSNLTNLLVVADRGGGGSDFAARTILPWVACVVTTLLVVLAWRWRALGAGSGANADAERVPFRAGPGTLGAVAAVVAMLATRQPALWVLGAGLVAAAADVVVRRRLELREALAVTNPVLLGALFVVASAVGWFARTSGFAAGALAHRGVVTTAVVAALTTVVINNLPAASFYAAHALAHPFALLVGLDVGPNLAVTGALSSLLWRRVAAREGAATSLATFSRVGLVVVVVAGAAATGLLSG
ncbi:MAG TPA: SLC13 family permease [Acidimicrobiales bacterium]|nr:SLC13 family permease [Acidimicrobiales bacterium]